MATQTELLNSIADGTRRVRRRAAELKYPEVAHQYLLVIDRQIWELLDLLEDEDFLEEFSEGEAS